MVISGTLAVAGAVVASFSGALIAGSNLFSGWRQRKFAELQQKLQMQFQRALQDRNFAESERIQREMAQLQYENALALQRENFSNQEALWEANKFYENAWPFRMTPKGYVSQLEDTYKFGHVPLQILIPNTLTEQLPGFGGLIKQYYPLQSATPVYYYDGGWKDGRTINGGALLSSLYEVLKGLPTLVLLPQGSFRDSFSLEVGYWGLGQGLRSAENVSGEVSDTSHNGQNDNAPKRISIISSLDMYKLELKLVRAQADRLIADYGTDTSHDDNNMEVRRREIVRERELEARGESRDKIERQLENEFVKSNGAGKKNTYKLGGRDVEDSKREIVKQICDVVCVAYSDVYHLLESCVMPHAPLLASANPMFADAGVRNALCTLYRGILNECKNSDESRLLYYPLYCALIVESLHRAGWQDEARQFEKDAESALRELYPYRVNNVANTHVEAIRILRKNGISLAECPVASAVPDCSEEGGCDRGSRESLGMIQNLPPTVGYVGKYSGGISRKRF